MEFKWKDTYNKDAIDTCPAKGIRHNTNDKKPKIDDKISLFATKEETKLKLKETYTLKHQEYKKKQQIEKIQKRERVRMGRFIRSLKNDLENVLKNREERFRFFGNSFQYKYQVKNLHC
jgi:hypothetical protein